MQNGVFIIRGERFVVWCACRVGIYSDACICAKCVADVEHQQYHRRMPAASTIFQRHVCELLHGGVWESDSTQATQRENVILFCAALFLRHLSSYLRRVLLLQLVLFYFLSLSLLFFIFHACRPRRGDKWFSQLCGAKNDGVRRHRHRRV